MEWSTNAFNNIVGIQNYYTEWMKQNIVMILYACIWNPRDFQQTYSDKKKKNRLVFFWDRGLKEGQAANSTSLLDEDCI